MKQLFCYFLSAVLLLSTTVAGQLSGKNIISDPITPTPVGEIAVSSQESNDDYDLSISDYAGRVKTYTYIDNYGNTSKIVYNVGIAFEDIVLPEGNSDWIHSETVYDLPSDEMTKESYTISHKTNSRDYYKGNTYAATLYEDYEVWYFDSGKVHIYSYSLSLSTASGFGSSEITYGNIINTDGSVSYTEDFRVTIKGLFYNQVNPFNFIVTPTYYSFF